MMILHFRLTFDLNQSNPTSALPLLLLRILKVMLFLVHKSLSMADYICLVFSEVRRQQFGGVRIAHSPTQDPRAVNVFAQQVYAQNTAILNSDKKGEHS